MAQRNPMNQRYQGDGPGGQTRKSAARAKPATQAASSVHIKKAPQTDSEKRAARKAREKEMEQKARERARRAADRAREQAREGSDNKAEGDGSANGSDKRTIAKSTPAASAAAEPKGFLGKLLAPVPNMPTSEEYKKWRKVYWVLIIVGVVFVVFSFAGMQVQLYDTTTPVGMIVLVPAYICIIGAIIVDFRKVKPLVKAHQKGAVGNLTPKQAKHDLEAKERAAAIEAARKAARDAKRAPRRKKSDTLVPGENNQQD